MAIPLESLSYTVLNLHTANRNSTSLCGIGIYVINGKSEVLLKYILAKPKTKTFSFEKHGYFRKADVLGAPSLNEVWSEILPYIKEKNVVFYDKEKSLKILHDSLVSCGIDMPYFRSVDVLDLFYDNHANYSYAELARACKYSDNFKTGDVYENLKLFRACVEHGAKYGSKALQKAFGVKSKVIPLSEVEPPPERGSYVIDMTPPDDFFDNVISSAANNSMTSADNSSKNPGFGDSMKKNMENYEERLTQMSPEERAAEDKKNAIGCAVSLIVFILFAVWWFNK